MFYFIGLKLHISPETCNDWLKITCLSLDRIYMWKAISQKTKKCVGTEVFKRQLGVNQKISELKIKYVLIAKKIM